MYLTHFYFTLPDSNVTFLYATKFAKQPSRFKDYKYLMNMLDRDIIGSCGYTNQIGDLDYHLHTYSIERAKVILAEIKTNVRYGKIQKIKAIPITIDIGKFELDNLDWAELVEGDEGICVENEHGTQFPISDLSDLELDVVLGIYKFQKEGITV